MKTQFTPGPGYVNSPYIEDQHGTIAKVMRPEDNASLIAAAHEIHDALREVTSELEAALKWQLENNRISVVVATQRQATIEKARSALAKAKGE